MRPLTDPAQIKARDQADQYHMLLAFFLAAIIYGIYIIIFICSVKITLKSKRSQWTFSAMVFFVASFVFLVITTIYMGVNGHRILYAFSPAWTEASNGMYPIDYLRNLTTTWDTFMTVVLTNVLTWLADALIIYRCYIVWERNFWVIILPVLLLLLSFVNCTITLVWFNHPTTLGPTQIIPLLNMIYPVNIAQSCLTTGLITFKIWRQYILSRAAGLYGANSGGTKLPTVIRIIVESAMIFTLQQVMLCIFYFIESPVQYIFLGTLVPSIGVVFVLLAIRAYAIAKSETIPNLRWPPSSSGSRSLSGQSVSSPSNSHAMASARSSRPTRRTTRHLRRSASESVVFATDASVYDRRNQRSSAVTLTIPDTDIYSSGSNSMNDQDLEKGWVSGVSNPDVGLGHGDSVNEKEPNGRAFVDS